MSPTSAMASSQLSFCHLPLTSLTGVLRRIECSCIPCSRTDAPFAQCAPRLSGESNTGSCRVHTPFSTVASTAQPTEQCVQTVRLTSTFVASPSFAAAAGPMAPNGIWLANAPAPATRPERFKNVRRSSVGSGTPARRRRRGPAAATLALVLVSSMILPPPGELNSGRAVIIANVLRFAIRGILIGRNCVGPRRCGRWQCASCHRDGAGAARTEGQQESSALEIGGAWVVRRSGRGRKFVSGEVAHAILRNDVATDNRSHSMASESRSSAMKQLQNCATRR